MEKALLWLAVIVQTALAGGEPSPIACIRAAARLVRPPPTAEPLRPDEINYRVYGEHNQQTIVLIHGLNSSSGTWDEIAAALKSRFRVIVYDQRGHGLTSAVGEDYSSTLLAQDLKALLDSLHIEKAAILGHSMGGRTAVQFASLYPDRVESLIVEDMHMLGRHTKLPDNLELSRALKALPKEFDSRESAYAQLRELMPEIDARDLSEHAMHRNFNGSFSFDHRLEVGALYQVQGLQEDLTAALEKVKAPTLFLAADPREHPVLWGKGVDAVKAAKPDAKIEVIQGAGHTIHHDRPDDFLAVVRGFLKEHEGAYPPHAYQLDSTVN